MTKDQLLNEINNRDVHGEDTFHHSLDLLSDEHSEKLTVKQFLEFVLMIFDENNTMDIDTYIASL